MHILNCTQTEIVDCRDRSAKASEIEFAPRGVTRPGAVGAHLRLKLGGADRRLDTKATAA